MTITRYHPLETQLWQVLQKELDAGFLQVLDEVGSVVKQRAALYDNEKPIWHRVPLPAGAIQEVVKKMQRAESKLAMPDPPVDEIEDDFIDSIAYLAFAISQLRMTNGGVDAVHTNR